MIDCLALLGETPMMPRPPKVCPLVELPEELLDELESEVLVPKLLVVEVPVVEPLLAALELAVLLLALSVDEEPNRELEPESEPVPLVAPTPASVEEPPARGWPKKPSVCVLFCP